MMDPFSAVSLAGTVVQLLDVSIKILAKTKEIYRSAEGVETRNVDLEAITQNLISLNKRVKNRSKKACAYAISDNEKALEDMTQKCNSIGETLIATLQNAKVQDSHRRWKSVRQALKSVLGTDKIEDLYNRLKQYREEIVVVLLFIINEKQTSSCEALQDMKQNLQDTEARIIEQGRQSRTQILDAISKSRYDPHSPEDVTTVSHLLSNVDSHAFDSRNTMHLLNSLYYERMQDRREYITKAHAKTFNWALEGLPEGPTPWSDLSRWLKSGNGIYWISGKAGSGKSTLMKYINFDERTENYLREWSAPRPLVTASFYFWNSGTSMQKSQIGLLRCLLYEIVKQKPKLIPKALPSLWNFISTHGKVQFDWTISELIDAFNRLATTDIEAKYCFLIDGLDEFDGDHQTLVDLLFEITRSSNIKILASSRPWLVFKDAFQDSPKLILQDLTHNDIKTFTHDSLHRHSRFDKLLSLEPERAPKLVTEIVNKASGVFLWVYLVVKSLIDGLTNADRISDLQRRLEVLPTDLEQYFLHILTSLDSFYLYQASQLFRLAVEAGQPLSLLTFSYLDEDDPKFALNRNIKPLSENEEATRCEVIERRLDSRCKGLLESRRRQLHEEYSTPQGTVAAKVSYEVDFLHRTVRDFLNTPTVRVKLIAPDDSTFNANMTLTGAFVAQIKGLRPTSHPESNFQMLWSLVFPALHHISRVGGYHVTAEAKVALLDELDRAATTFKDKAIVKQHCHPAAHWVNTGYRFGVDPRWDYDLLTLCIQQNLIFYAREKLSSGISQKRSKPLLAFALVAPISQTYRYIEFPPVLGLNSPRPEMIKLILNQGGDPNQQDEDHTIWVRFLAAMKKRAKSFTPTEATSWFESTILFLRHGADPNVSFSSEVIGSGGMTPKTSNVSEIIREVFSEKAGCDVAELEDILEEVSKPKRSSSPKPTSPQLSVPHNGFQESAKSLQSSPHGSHRSQHSQEIKRKDIPSEINQEKQQLCVPPQDGSRGRSTSGASHNSQASQKIKRKEVPSTFYESKQYLYVSAQQDNQNTNNRARSTSGASQNSQRSGHGPEETMAKDNEDVSPTNLKQKRNSRLSEWFHRK